MLRHGHMQLPSGDWNPVRHNAHQDKHHGVLISEVEENRDTGWGDSKQLLNCTRDFHKVHDGLAFFETHVVQ